MDTSCCTLMGTWKRGQQCPVGSLRLEVQGIEAIKRMSLVCEYAQPNCGYASLGALHPNSAETSCESVMQGHNTWQLGRGWAYMRAGEVLGC
eukprot:1147909-Pelagomonas_calceolata.AAC.5